MQLITDVRTQFDKTLSIASSSVLLQRATISPIIKSLGIVKANLSKEEAKSPENSYRTYVIEMLGRIPIVDIPRQTIPDLVKSCYQILEEDNEDNGFIAHRIVAEIHKSYKQGLEDITRPYFEWLLKLFKGFQDSAIEILKMSDSGGDHSSVPASRSMKIAQDVASTLFPLFQSYGRRLTQFGEELFAAMVKAASFAGPELNEVSQGSLSVYSDFRMAQVKTIMFLILLSRSPTAQPIITSHKETLCSSLVRIMKTAPNSLGLRKELLNCLRSTLANEEFKSGLISKVDDLLDIETLVGTDKTVSQGLMHIAFIHLTELLLMCKEKLTIEQINKVVDLAVKSLLDSTAHLALHVTSVRVLYNIVVDILFPRRAEDVRYRDTLSNILGCMAMKLEGLKVQIPRILAISRELEAAKKRRKAGDAEAAKLLNASGKLALDAQFESVNTMLNETTEDERKVDIKTEQFATEDAMEVDEVKEDKGSDDKTLPSEQEDGVRATATPPFKTVYQASTHISMKERELLEFRNLAHGLLNTTKTVAFVIIVFHTSRGLKSPVSSGNIDTLIT